MAQPLTNEIRDFLLDDDNDIVITTDIQWSSGIQAVVQSCRIALQMFAGEWFLDLDAGIRYFDGILGAKPDVGIAIARDEFRRELLAVEGVISLLRLDVAFSAATRALVIRWQVSTALGDTPVDLLSIAVPV